jgi:hypothetical protein
MGFNPYATHLSLIETLQKESTIIAKNGRLDDQHSRNLGGLNLHQF